MNPKSLQLTSYFTAQVKVLVVGDVMLDRYWFGDVDRISPEAPVPVVKVTRTEERPGGAGNVARNVAALGSKALLLSVTGTDEASKTLEKLLADEKVKTLFHLDPNIATTVKLRVIGRQQQLIRVDFEAPPTREVLAAKLSDYSRLIETCDIVILSDYGKGGLAHIAEMMALAVQHKKRVLIDPKGNDWEKYRKAYMITPNLNELRQVIGSWADEDDLHGKVEDLRHKLAIEAILVTRSEEGMSLFTHESVKHIPTVAKEIYDVTGAGDTVIATLSVMLGAGESLDSAVRFANKAAGIVVGKFGTAVATLEELT